MDVTWLGHAAFLLQGNGFSIVTDPYDPESSGLDPIRSRADLVVMSSALDEAHSSWEQVPGDPKVVNALDAVDAPVPFGRRPRPERDRRVEGSDRPDDPKANAMYWLELDGVIVFHMGDIGTPLTPEQETRLPRRVDVLLALAGAKLTIALPDLDTVIDRLARGSSCRCTSPPPGSATTSAPSRTSSSGAAQTESRFETAHRPRSPLPRSRSPAPSSS